MIKISKMADYATQIMHVLTRQSCRLSAARIAKLTAISEPTVSKLLKKLAETGLLLSVQGAKGGYQLSKLPEKISLAALISAIDGLPAMTECSKPGYHCYLDHHCTLQGNWQYINQIVYNVLDRISLQDMVNAVPDKQTEYLLKSVDA